MVKLSLNLRAELDHLTELRLVDPLNYQFFFKVKCTSCHEIHPNWVEICRSAEYPLPGSKGNANFVWKCQFCKRDASASFTDLKLKSFPVYLQAHSQDRKFQPICTIDCRGCEFIQFDLRGSWCCRGDESGTEFTEIEFEDGEWHEYDEKASLPVSVTNIQTEIVRA